MLIHHGADVLIGSVESGETPLHVATRSGHTEIVRLLLERCAPAATSSSNRKGISPLHYACEEGFHEIVRLLLDYSADLSSTDLYGRTALWFACNNGHTESVRVLLEHAANVSNTSTTNYLPFKRLLLNSVAGPVVDSNIEWSPTHEAAYHGYFDVLKLLLDNRADLRLANDYSQTTLHVAAQQDIPELIEWLLARGFDALDLDDYGRSWFDWASACRIL